VDGLVGELSSSSTKGSFLGGFEIDLPRARGFENAATLRSTLESGREETLEELWPVVDSASWLGLSQIVDDADDLLVGELHRHCEGSDTDS
jgi:hypothetical protein